MSKYILCCHSKFIPTRQDNSYYIININISIAQVGGDYDPSTQQLKNTIIRTIIIMHYFIIVAIIIV